MEVGARIVIQWDLQTVQCFKLATKAWILVLLSLKRGGYELSAPRGRRPWLNTDSIQ